MTPLDLPIGVPEGAATLQLLERIAAAVEKTGDKSAEASQKTETAWERAQAKITAAANAFNETREAVTGFAEMVGALAERMVTSASASERMERAQLQLNLNFEAAAEAAGGYINQVELATAAQTLAEQGIRLHQDELSGLARVAQNYARTSGKEFAEAMDQVVESVTEGGESMGKLDTALLAVADTARFTAEDRLGALVDRARQIAPAARTAAEEMHAFQGALEQAEQAFAHGFVESMASFRSGTGDAVDKLKEMKDEMRAAGMVVGEIVTRAGAGLQILIGGLVAGLGSVVGLLRAAGAGIGALISRGDVGAAAATEFRNAMTQGIVGDAVRMVAEQMERLERMDDDRTSMAAPTVGGTRADVNRDDAARHQRQGGSSSSSSSSATQGADMTFGADEATYGAEELRRRASEQARFRQQQERDGMDERIAAERRAQAHQPGSTLGDRMDQREAERRQREFAQQMDAQQSYTDFMRDMHSERASAARLEAEAVTMGFDAMGGALAKHVQAFATGREGIGEAAQGMLADMLSALGQEAIVKGAMQMAEGAAMLAGIYTAPLAAGHFAAGAAFLGVGALAAAAGAALAPAPSMPSAGGGGAAASSRADTFGRPASDNDRGGGQTIVNHYYAPIIGGRDALDSEVGERMGRYQDAASSRQVRDRGDRSRRAA